MLPRPGAHKEFTQTDPKCIVLVCYVSCRVTIKSFVCFPRRDWARPLGESCSALYCLPPLTFPHLHVCDELVMWSGYRVAGVRKGLKF